MKNKLFIIVAFFFVPYSLLAQFILNNDASTTFPLCSTGSTTYELTPATSSQDGEIWYTTQVSLTNRFDIQFQMYLGTRTYASGNGADGVCFVFQQQSTNAGSIGSGMGFGGITPSLGVEFDTYQNGWDPAYCHTAIEKNGDVDHTDGSGNNLAGPTQLSPTTATGIPDGAWHPVEVIWNPIYDSLSVYFDCSFRVGYKGNIVSNIFGGNPNVYWGFTAGTGLYYNLQEVCLVNSYLNNLRDTSVCQGNAVNLIASPGETTYSWAPAAGLNTTTTASVIATPTTTTTYSVTETNGCGLISKDSVTVTVTSNLTLTANASPTSICSGSLSNLTATGPAGTTYSWSFGGATTNSTTVTPGLTTTYTVTGTNGGCTGTATVMVTVNTTPTIIVNSATICSGMAAILTATGATSYSWNNSSTNNPLTISPPTTTNYTVTGTSNGCTNTAISTVTVSPKPVIDTLNASVSGPLCKGMLGSITGITASGGNAPYTYSWSPTGQATATGLSAGTYTLTVTAANGCTSTSGPYIITNSVVTASFTANPDSGSIALQVNFNNTSTGASSYEWNLGNGDTTNAVNPNNTYENTGTYNVELIATNSNGCKDTAYEKIVVAGQSILIIPNVFSPNGDDKNDVFKVKSTGINSFDAQIFDRWGIKLFEWNNVNDGWDGKTKNDEEAPAGTYYYLINATGVDGKQYKEKGYLTLLR